MEEDSAQTYNVEVKIVSFKTDTLTVVAFNRFLQPSQLLEVAAESFEMK